MDPSIPLVVSQVNPDDLEGHPGHHRQPELLDDAARAAADGPPRLRRARAGRSSTRIRRSPAPAPTRSPNSKARSGPTSRASPSRRRSTPIRSPSTRCPRSMSSSITATRRRSGRSSARAARSSTCRTCGSRARRSGCRSSSRHSEAVHVETRDPITPDQARGCSGRCRGVVVQDDPSTIDLPACHRRGRQRRHLRRAGPDRPIDRRTAAGSRSGSSATTSARARPRTPSRSPRCSWSGTGCGRRPLAAVGRARRRGRGVASAVGRRGSGVTHAERRAALEVVAAEVRACTRCRLHETRTHAVPGRGARTPRSSSLARARASTRTDRAGRSSAAPAIC